MPRSPQVGNRWAMTWSSPAATRVAPASPCRNHGSQAAPLRFKVNPRVATRQITHAAQFVVVPAHLGTTATATNCFFSAA
jgi:hypothetical protein